MKKVSFEGIGQMVVTMAVAEGVKAGDVVNMQDNGAVGPCMEGGTFCGVVLDQRGGYGGVQLKGMVKVTYSGKLSVGWVTLAADGMGGVGAADTGVRALVVERDSVEKTAVICL